MVVLKLKSSGAEFSVTPPLAVMPRRNERQVNLCHFRLEDDIRHLVNMLQEAHAVIDRIEVQVPFPYNIFAVLDGMLHEICEEVVYV
jgi:hypothetical protein